jgi:hypothetical protein
MQTEDFAQTFSCAVVTVDWVWIGNRFYGTLTNHT